MIQNGLSQRLRAIIPKLDYSGTNSEGPFLSVLFTQGLVRERGRGREREREGRREKEGGREGAG